MTATAVAREAHRQQILDAVRERLRALEPIMGEVTSVRITIRLRKGAGTPYSIVVEPECRFESTG